MVHASAGRILSHYDAKAHLVVARRVLDSLTPGWTQLGAVWLPLPHLVNLLPVQIDVLYRSGAFASLVSALCFGTMAWSGARLVEAITGSRAGAVTFGALLVLNPNLLYLNATPMTEPMAVAATFLVVWWTYEWVIRASPAVPLRLGLALFAAAWTRYEAWLVVFSAIALAAVAQWRQGTAISTVARSAVRMAAWPAAAIVLFLLHSRATTGSWFVTGGFYELDPFYDGLFWRSAIAVWWGTHRLGGYVLESVALAAAGVAAYRALRHGPAAPLVAFALFAAAALPFYAFFEGHPYRVRYMVAPLVACALFAGIGVGMWRRAGAAVGIGLVLASLVEVPPWDAEAALVVESQWDVPRSLERRAVTECLARGYRNERVFASMASLAHYMQELSHEGFAIADFVHEGNGPLWVDGIDRGVAHQAGWMLTEEQAEGGDALARRLRESPAFGRGMTRICEGGGVALYRRDIRAAVTSTELGTTEPRRAP
jgi:hypothetical protein